MTVFACKWGALLGSSINMGTQNAAYAAAAQPAFYSIHSTSRLLSLVSHDVASLLWKTRVMHEKISNHVVNVL
jgi:hypothetical protein